MAVLQDAIQNDLADFSKLIPVLKKQIQDGIAVVRKIRAKYSNSDINTASGMSFMELKNQLMLNYLQNLTLLMLKKTSGASIDNDPATHRLVEIRTILERMRPIETKLKYHIDKLMKASTGGDINPNDSDPLSFRPNPDQLISTMDNEESGEDEVNDAPVERKRTDIYVPPKMAAVPYNFDETPKDRAAKKADRDKKRALNSSIMQEIRHDYYDEPEEIYDRDIFRMKSDKKEKEREAYEERNMTRLTVSKKDKDRSKRMTTMNSLQYLTDFHDFRAMAEADQAGSSSGGISMAKKRKNPGQKKGKKSKKYKKH